MTTILLLDGEPTVADAVRRGLGADGITVETAVRAQDALALIAARDFACVVTELSTPDLRGAALVERLVAEKPGTPVIILTAREQVASALAAHRTAVYDVCPKPVDLPQLAIAIRRAIERRTLASEVERLRKIVEHMGTVDEGNGMTLEQVERRHILRVITTHRGNKAAAAAVLGVDRKTLYRKLLRYGNDG